MEQEQNKNIEQPNSVEVSINAKGQWSGKVKSYAATVDEAMARTLQKAEELESIIQKKNGI